MIKQTNCSASLISRWIKSNPPILLKLALFLIARSIIATRGVRSLRRQHIWSIGHLRVRNMYRYGILMFRRPALVTLLGGLHGTHIETSTWACGNSLRNSVNTSIPKSSWRFDANSYVNESGFVKPSHLTSSLSHHVNKVRSPVHILVLLQLRTGFLSAKREKCLAIKACSFGTHAELLLMVALA